MWKTFYGRCIYQSQQGIRVLENPLFRWLQFDSKALQTVINRYAPHRPELNYINYLIQAVQLNPQHCCMLGLGGGGTAHALSSILKDYNLTIIEISAEVIDLARRFFMINRLTNLNIIHEEASLFLSQCNTQFEHLLIDLFTAHNFPSQCNNEEFFKNCRQVLRPGGILAVNLANAREHWPLFQLIQKQFSHSTLVIPVPYSANLIVFAQNSGTINPLLDALKEKRQIQELTWTSTWGYIGNLRK